jgi:hypothetical protein
MRKELLLAIFIGMTMGLIITFGIYQSRENSRENKNHQTDDLVKQQVDDSLKESSQLSITTPEENLLTDQENLIVSGSTSPDSFVIIFVNSQENITSSDETGNFSLEVTLDEGANLIEIYSIDEDGNSISKEKSVIYDAEYLNDESAEAEDNGEESEEDSEEAAV